MRRIDLGGVTIEKFTDGDDDLDFGLNRLLVDATEEQVDEIIAVFGSRHINVEKRALRLSMHSFVVRTPHHVVLVDTCLGNDKERPARPKFHHRVSPYLDNLRALGLSPEDVDFVLCTHMHYDHTGWNTRLHNGRWTPTFPNARYIMARREYEHWLALSKEQPPEKLLHGSFADSVLPVVESGQAVLVDDDDFICEHVRYEHCPGHSPGNVLIHIEGSHTAAVCSGDVIHSPIQFHFPTLLTSCDDPELARTNRLKLIEQIADTSTLLLPAHFKDPTAGHVCRAGERYAYRFIED